MSRKGNIHGFKEKSTVNTTFLVPSDDLISFKVRIVVFFMLDNLRHSVTFDLICVFTYFSDNCCN